MGLNSIRRSKNRQILDLKLKQVSFHWSYKHLSMELNSQLSCLGTFDMHLSMKEVVLRHLQPSHKSGRPLKPNDLCFQMIIF
jgi:hypothetical protein